jgi:hypothetical protein
MFIAVTSDQKELFDAAYNKACALFPAQITPIIRSPFNSYVSFFIGPDGAKEGSDESVQRDSRREELKKWLPDSLQWVEVQYGDDDRQTKIIADSDRPRPCENTVPPGDRRIIFQESP